jgi:hypothetical protein
MPVFNPPVLRRLDTALRIEGGLLKQTQFRTDWIAIRVSSLRP